MKKKAKKTMPVAASVTSLSAASALTQPHGSKAQPPVQAQLHVVDLNQEGQGIARPDEGPVAFVPGALPGEILDAKLIKSHKNYNVYRPTSWLKESPDRQKPFCPIFKQCGGCTLQHLSLEASALWKAKHVRDCLLRIAHIPDETLDEVMRPCLQEASPALAYRNKVSYSFTQNAQGLCLGFYAPRSHQVIPATRCAIEPSSFWIVRETLQDALNDAIRRTSKNRELWSAYDETKHEGLLRKLVLRRSEHLGQIMLILVTKNNACDKKFLRTLPERLNQALENQGLSDRVTSFYLNLHAQADNRILGDHFELLWGDEHIYERLCGLDFQIRPASFFQVNSHMTERLYQSALDLSKPQTHQLVFDLYCGTGTISSIFATRAKEVHGVEIVPQAVLDARANALTNHLDQRLHFHLGRSEDIVPELIAQGIQPDLIVLDPPRKGCEASLLQCITQTKVPQIVYVSCHPASLARDLTLLTEKGYVLKAVQPVDLFPWTSHVECVVLMSRTGE